MKKNIEIIIKMLNILFLALQILDQLHLDASLLLIY